ncbi:hypothetical protein BGV48_30415 [Burkholderia ubonensis]|nr:hypothetical protein BGV48_30415 [Burkholderia ubonensis]
MPWLVANWTAWLSVAASDCSWPGALCAIYDAACAFCGFRPACSSSAGFVEPRPPSGVEQLVQLEAVAAAPPLDQLVDDCGQVERDARAGQRIEVFERDRLRMQQVDAAQHVEGRRDGAVVTDAGEIA